MYKNFSSKDIIKKMKGHNWEKNIHNTHFDEKTRIQGKGKWRGIIQRVPSWLDKNH